MHNAPHLPVMLEEVLAALEPQAGRVYVDATFGAGGYSRAILEACESRVIGVDRDPEAVHHAAALAEEFGARFTFLPGRFAALPELLASIGMDQVDGIVFDIGVSSMQLDAADRGFSFQKDGPLDMRMSQEGASAADVVNTAKEEDIADILYTYGEEKKSRRVARAIVQARGLAPITTTLQLADIVRRALGGKRGDKIDPATRTFQALRIYVNQELAELEAGLRAAAALLREGGRLVVVTFHSLEDRIVKRFLAGEAKTTTRSRHLPEAPSRAPLFHALTRKPVLPTPEEIRRNPRARSARLRAAIRTEAP